MRIYMKCDGPCGAFAISDQGRLPDGWRAVGMLGRLNEAVDYSAFCPDCLTPEAVSEKIVALLKASDAPRPTWPPPGVSIP